MLTCHGLSQSRGRGKAPTQAPTTVQVTVIWRQVSHTDIALEMERSKEKSVILNLDTQDEYMKHITKGQGAGTEEN